MFFKNFFPSQNGEGIFFCFGKMPEAPISKRMALGKCPNRDFGDFMFRANARSAKFKKVSIRAMPERQNSKKRAFGHCPRGKIQKRERSGKLAKTKWKNAKMLFFRN